MKTRAKLWLLGLVLGLLVPGTAAFAVTTVSLTFDDGLSDDPTIVTYLDSYKMPGTFYIISGSINNASGDYPGYMTLDQIKAIAADPVVTHEIGGHTITHMDLAPTGTQPTAAAQLHEICDGRAQLIGMGLSPVVSFAYPSGDASLTTESIVKSCGFTSGRGAGNCIRWGSVCSDTEINPFNFTSSSADAFWLRTPEAVTTITSSTTLQNDVMEGEAASNGWVILQFHHLCDGAGCDQYSVGTSTFTAFLSWLQGQVTAGTVQLKTVGQVMGGFTSSPPIPAIVGPTGTDGLGTSGLSPSTVTVLGSSFTLTVNGVNFVSGATVNWNGSSTGITTTFVSATQLTAVIPATDIATLQITTISVTNPGGAVSPGTLLTLVNPVPVLTTISPSSTTVEAVGGPALTLTVTGSNFVPTAAVRWNGSSTGITTTFVSSTSLTAVIPASDLTTVKIDSVTVFNPTPGGGVSASTQIFTVIYPLPALTSLTPNTAIVGSSTTTLTLTGSNFVSSSTVRWNGATISTTTYVNATTLRMQIPSSALATVGVSSVTVFNPLPGGGTSSTQTFTVGNPVPTLTALSTNYVLVGSPQFTLTLTGTNFVASSFVQWNGQTLSTVGTPTSTSISVTVPAGNLAAVGVSTLTVTTPATLSGTVTTAGLNFTVANPIPTLVSLSTTTAIVGSPTFALTVTGTNYVPSSTVIWNSSARATTFVNNTTLSVVIPATDLALTGSFTVNVVNAAPGGGTSNGLIFTVGNPAPGIVSLSPSFALIGSPAGTMTVTGLNFVPGSVVQWNGSAKVTSVINSTTLSVLVTAGDLSSVGISTVTVVNPLPGGGTSNGQPFTVGYPVPTLITLSTTTAIVGNPAFTLTVTGLNFAAPSVVQWNGSARTTTYSSPTQLSAQILAADLTTVGPNTVTVFTAAPGGGTSTGLTFTVGNPVPVLNSLSLSPIAGTSSLTLTLTGSKFVASSIAQWNGSPRDTTYLNSTTLTAAIPAADMAGAATAIVTVFNPLPSGGTSNALSLASGGIASITDPTLATVTPTAALAGAPAFTMTVTGTNFASNVVVEWNNVPQPTTFVSSTELTAAIPASLVSAAGTAAITVVNLNTGGHSAGQTFTIGSNQVRVHPNPWRANLHAGQLVTFDELPADSTVKIFTSSAHWIRTLSAPAGSATWDLKNDSGDNVASGYYIYLVTNPQGKSRGIVAIIR